MNKDMKPNRWRIPHVDDILEDLYERKIFTNIELLSGYRKIHLEERCKDMKNFCCRYGTFQLELMPLEIMNVRDSFQIMMERLLRLLTFVDVYLDDIVIKLNIEQENHELMKQVFRILRKHELKVTLKKSFLMLKWTLLLGHIVNENIVHTDPYEIDEL